MKRKFFVIICFISLGFIFLLFFSYVEGHEKLTIGSVTMIQSTGEIIGCFNAGGCISGPIFVYDNNTISELPTSVEVCIYDLETNLLIQSALCQNMIYANWHEPKKSVAVNMPFSLDNLKSNKKYQIRIKIAFKEMVPAAKISVYLKKYRCTSLFFRLIELL